ncbi:glycosyltransferase [Arenicella xantha]|uniref:GT2 family glycosyltransferase n=1 Tax=Arenicella xantha TaxID=644221 RepID=A0A395JG79_9GAMM|nr:glycosyltransferase [Arenicella xantha]RBP48357.1 GT2 family glycosyltransferase [Arenicella xantha]
MPDQSKLLELNSTLGLKSGIYQNTEALFRDSTLSNYLQIAISDMFDKVDDKSLFSLDIETQSNTDELRSALSLSQFRFLQAFDLNRVNRVLDLSEDFGGVAHYIADNVGQVDSVKVDSDLARISARRCANKPNVAHISEDLSKLNFPAKHYDLIIIGQLEALAIEDAQFDELLSKLQKSLSPTGVLIANVINSNRFAKWFDPAVQVNDSELAYADLYAPSNAPQTLKELSRKQLRDRLLSADFSAIDIHANFSKGTDCRSLFSEDYLTSSVNGLNHFYRLGSIENPSVNEYLLYKNLVGQKRNLTDLANRYLVIAGASTAHTRELYDNDFSHFPGTGRQAKWRTLTSRARSSTEVIKTALYPDSRDATSSLVQQNLAPQPFYKGKLLVDDWLQALLDDDHLAFEGYVREYTDWLDSLAKTDDFTNIAYDLLPFNLVLNTRGARAFNPIDTEWQINTEFSADFVLFRALFWFAFENKPLLQAYATSNDIYSLGTFIVRYMPNAYQVDDLAPFVELEERIQADIDKQFRANAVSNALLQTFDGDTPEVDDTLSLEAVWGNQQGAVNDAFTQSTKWLKESTTHQSLSLTLSQFDSNYPILRLDPMATNGAFIVHSATLIDEQKSTLWSLPSPDDIASAATLHGVTFSDGVFTALNQDPYLCFDLSDVVKADSTPTLALEIEWLWDAHYSSVLNTLSQAVSDQGAAMGRQSQRLDQYRAEIEYQAQRIEDLLGHRVDLTKMVKDEELRAQRTQARMQGEIKHLNHMLHAQHVRNEELHGYLLMRPTTRAKRIARRWLNRLTGKPMVAVQPAPEAIKPAQDSSPLPRGELIGQNTEDYGLWVRENTLSEQQIESAKAEIEAMAIKPVFSILVPIYNTDPEYLLPMIESVRRQIYPHWQLCLVDDCSPKTYLKQILKHESLQDERISIQLNDTNQGISVTTNDALAMANGDYIALLDHDDEISIDALYENAKVINNNPDVGLIYSDEDKMDMQGNRLEPYFKPDFSPDLLHTNNYVCHFTVIKKAIADEIGGFREGLDGSQDHDIILRAANASKQIVHIPKILYHWRKIPGSTAVVYDAKSYAWEAGRKAVEDILQKQENGVRVEFGSLKGTYRVHRDIQDEPLVSIIVPFKDRPELLDACLNSILNRTSYTNFEIVGVSNSSSEPRTFERMQAFSDADSRVRFVEKNIPFNFSAICNYGVEQAQGNYIVLLNNDIEIISPDWIERMLEHAQRETVGAVGAKLLYPDGRIQHAGVVAGMVGAAGHPHKFFPDNHIGYHGRLHMVYNVSAVTGAMLMVSKKHYHEVGGLDEQGLAVAYNDIDFCLKLLGKGYYNVFTPHAKATHHESISRGYEDTDEKMQRLLTEQRVFLDRWSDFLEAGDPYYNPNLSLKNERFSLRFKD